MIQIMLMVAVGAGQPMYLTQSRNVAGWEQKSSKSSCTVEKYTDNLDSFRVTLDGDDIPVISLYNDDWVSVKENGNYNVTLAFSDGSVWRDEARGHSNPSLQLYGISMAWTGTGVVDAISNSTSVRVTLGTKPIGTYSLEGSTRAVVALRRCVDELRVADPFAGS